MSELYGEELKAAILRIEEITLELKVLADKLNADQRSRTPQSEENPRPASSLNGVVTAQPDKSEAAQKLEDTHKWSSEQSSQPAGRKNFL